ncbi:hypothetical protein Q6D67_15605 [Haliea sp. E1-2-M8]|uniref:hypothetical protein n=1 Tax=Haliea sp. E1-2-M8 TaxID=3064706 RepID=UPI002715B590|nr:hypothetical protein [Haliea sp. E1-2-M8]MDO8863132.1 hypothetical protein [Haliea sp. E1-2-M8]
MALIARAEFSENSIDDTMTIRLPTATLLVCLLHLLPAQAAWAESVAVNRGEGQGYVVTHRNNCYLILPDHVLGRSPTLSLSAGAPSVAGEAQVFQRFPGIDLAIAFVRDDLQGRCSTPFRSLPRSSDILLATQGELSLVRVEASGIVTRTPVMIAEILYEQIEVRTNISGSELGRGTSGAFVFAGDVPVAMMIEARSAELGTALRIDAIVARIGRLLDGGPSMADPSVREGAPSAPSGPGHLPFRITACSPEVADPTFVCSGLETGAGPVVMPAGAQVVIEVEFERADQSSSVIRTVSLTSHAAETEEQAVPRAIVVEVDSSSGAQRRWRHLGSGDMSPFGEFKVNLGTGQLARRARILIVSSWQPDRPLRLDRVEFE